MPHVLLTTILYYNNIYDETQSFFTIYIIDIYSTANFIVMYRPAIPIGLDWGGKHIAALVTQSVSCYHPQCCEWY